MFEKHSMHKMYKITIFTSTIVILCILAFFFSTIIRPTHHNNKLHDNDLKGGDYLLALPIYDAAKIPSHHSYMALVSENGDSKILNINSMFYNQPTWSSLGLQFLDDKANYFIPNDSYGIRTIQKQKTDFQYGSTVFDPSTSISFLNNGSKPDHDGVIAVSTALGEYKEYEYSTKSAHSMSTFVTCNSKTYTIDETRDIENPQLHIALVYDGKTPQYTVLDTVLPEVDKLPDDLNKLLYHTPKVTHETNIGMAFCVNDMLATFLTLTSSVTEDRVSSVALFMWNPHTKQSSFTPLRDENGNLITATQLSEWGLFTSDENSSDKSSALLMSAVTGRVLSVDTTTGITHQFTKSHVEVNDQNNSHFYGRLAMRTTENYVFVFVLSENDTTGDMSRIHVYDRKNGQKIRTIHISKNINDIVCNSTNKFGYPAVNPTRTVSVEK